MESDRAFTPKPEKPQILFHASSDSNIAAFQPRIGKRRDENEGAQVFATPSKALSTMFIVPTNDSWTQTGSIDGEPYIVISDKERFESLDNGGSIYLLPSDSFDTDLEKGLGELEYTSTQTVEPISSEFYPSGLQAMVEQGVLVFFVNQETFAAFSAAPADQIKDFLMLLTPLSKES